MPELPSGWLAVPAPVRALFKRFPLLTLSANRLPERAPTRTDRAARPALYVFASGADAARGRPSFNPGCLKWQTFLRIAGVQVRLVASNNHASPSGALPFLLPARRDLEPVEASRLEEFARREGSASVEEEDATAEAYHALLDFRIRNAWLHALYLTEENEPLLTDLYLSHTSNAVVRRVLLNQLRRAAETEILQSTFAPFIDPNALYEQALEAFAALSVRLGDENEWLSAGRGPSLLDANVFAYTHLILGAGLAWRNRRLVGVAGEFSNLARHERRMYQKYFAEDK